MFLLCVNYLLPQLDGSPSTKWRDKSRTKRNTVSTLRWWTVAADRSPSFKQIDGQVENWRRNCLYCCDDDLLLLMDLHLSRAIWGTGQEQKEKLFLLCDDDLLLLIDVRPLNKLMDRSRTQGETVSTLRWWFAAADGSPSFKDIYGKVENRRRKFFYFAMMIRCWKHMLLFLIKIGSS